MISPRETLSQIERQATAVRTPCGSGHMQWHIWGRGAPLVLLHGGSGSWTHWVRNIPELARHYRLVVGDTPGLGASDMPDEPVTAESLAAIVSLGIDELVPNGQPFDLVGFSFGGIVGGHVALAQAARIRSVTVVGSPALGLIGTGPANQVVSVPGDLPQAEQLRLHRRNLELLMFADPANIDDLALTLHIENMRRGRLRSRSIARRPVLAEALRQATCRIGGIFGSADVTVSPSMDGLRDFFHSVQPDCHFDVIEGAGHWVPYEAAEAFNTLLLDRLAGYAAADAAD